MDTELEKSFNRSRALLFGLLQSCLLEGNALEGCPFEQMRNSLSFEEKYRHVMALSDEEVDSLLKQHEVCFSRRIGTTRQE